MNANKWLVVVTTASGWTTEQGYGDYAAAREAAARARRLVAGAVVRVVRM